MSSCGPSHQSVGAGSEAALNLGKGAIGFSEVGALIFSPRCVSCHQPYNSYLGVRRELDSIATSVAANRMPKVGGILPDGLKLLLRNWIANGAPEFANQMGTEPEPAILEPNWNSISEEILQSRCLVCHNPNGQAKFLDLSTRQSIFAARNRMYGGAKRLIDFDSPTKSYLLEIVQDPIEPMPPIRSNIRRLNSNEIRVVTEWISFGLP